MLATICLRLVPAAIGFAVWIWWGIHDRKLTIRQAVKIVQSKRIRDREWLEGTPLLVLTYFLTAGLYAVTLWLVGLPASWPGLLAIGYLIALAGNYIGTVVGNLLDDYLTLSCLIEIYQ
ncbi:MAG: hypothetical protein Q8N84_00245 [bacterium]|nr:hypothetical protein [bacterium]